ncbi:hypothetical protein C8J57DRAFT_1220921 [Mycena rebaudengoi]|nr:hypothetical protein C8J57DRAFT_1220921 [Mycena rebaudengoi]
MQLIYLQSITVKKECVKDFSDHDLSLTQAVGTEGRSMLEYPDSRPMCNPPKPMKTKAKPATKPKPANKTKPATKPKPAAQKARGKKGEKKEEAGEMKKAGDGGEGAEGGGDKEEVKEKTTAEKRREMMAKKREKDGVTGGDKGGAVEASEVEVEVANWQRWKRAVRPPLNAEGECVEYHELKHKHGEEETAKGAKRLKTK